MPHVDINEAVAGCQVQPIMRPMPAGFAPEVVDDGRQVRCRFHAGQFVNVGFDKTGILEEDRRRLDFLAITVWEIVEYARCGMPDFYYWGRA